MSNVKYPKKLSLATTPTPLTPLKRLQSKYGGPLIWLKRDDLTGNLLSGNKVRKLEFILAKALADGVTAIITCGGVQSNHCRATAFAAAQLGLRCHLLLRGDQPQGAYSGNVFLDQLAGASLSFHSPLAFRQVDELFANQKALLESEGHNVLCIPVGGSDGMGVWGYINAVDELNNQVRHQKINVKSVVCASGSGGTQAGLVLGAKLHKSPFTIFGINICDDAAWFENKITQDIRDWAKGFANGNCTQGVFGDSPDSIVSLSDIQMIDGYVGEGYAKASDALMNTISEVARLEGVVFDPVYSGKAFNGLLNEIAKERFNNETDLIFIHTGGLFGLFPYAERF